jgi:hypothetical protein
MEEAGQASMFGSNLGGAPLVRGSAVRVTRTGENSTAAAQVAFRMMPTIEAAKAKEITALAGMAAELNAQGVPATGAAPGPPPA